METPNGLQFFALVDTQTKFHLFYFVVVESFPNNIAPALFLQLSSVQDKIGERQSLQSSQKNVIHILFNWENVILSRQKITS